MSRGGRHPLPAIFDEVSVGILLHDPETGAVRGANDSAEALYGYSFERLKELEVADLSVDTPRYSQEEAVRRIRKAATDEVPPFEWRTKHADGELLWTEVNLSRRTFGGETYVMAEVHDITERKRQERRLHLVNRILRHNLRNDMNVVLGNAELLREAVESEDVKRRARIIEAVARDLGDLSDDIGRIERLTTRKRSEAKTRPASDIVESVIDTARTEHPEADVTVGLDADGDVHDGESLRYALTHAVENAIEHHDGTPTVTVRVGWTDRGQLAVEVIDEGPTIPPMEVDALDREMELTETNHGTGVGLWVMDWCVESLGGELVFDENEPRGNVVRFLLPVQSP